MPTRFDTVVAVTMAAALGIVTFFLAGMVVVTTTVWLVPGLSAVLLGAAALGAVCLVALGRRSRRSFGVGMLIGWALLALWTSGMSVIA